MRTLYTNDTIDGTPEKEDKDTVTIVDGDIIIGDNQLDGNEGPSPGNSPHSKDTAKEKNVRNIIKQKILTKQQSKSNTQISLDDVMECSFIQNHNLEEKLAGITPDISQIIDFDMTQYLPPLADGIDVWEKVTNQKIDTKISNVREVKLKKNSSKKGTRIPYDKLKATKYTMNNLTFLNYTPKNDFKTRNRFPHIHLNQVW